MEALIHFNIGKNGVNKTHEYISVSDDIKIHVPDKDEILEIVTTVLIFLIYELIQRLQER
jgi:hypothetical protein